MNAYRMLEILIQQNQFELLKGKDEFHTPQDIRLVYLMNDAVECFLTFRNARITGDYLAEYDGELETHLDRKEERSALVVHQGHNVFTVFFEKLEPEYHLYDYGQIGHFWVKGYEYLRQLEYRIAILWDKYEYMGEDCCNEEEQKLAWLAKFPPLNFTCYPSVPPQYLPDREDGWVLAEEAWEVMLELAKESDDRSLQRVLVRYCKHPGKWMTKYVARLLHRKSHAKTIDLLAEKLKTAASAYPDRRKMGKNVVVFFMTVIAVAMSGAGFSKIINTAYRLCGYGGLVLVFYVIYNFIKNMNKVENERKNENTKVK